MAKTPFATLTCLQSTRSIEDARQLWLRLSDAIANYEVPAFHEPPIAGMLGTLGLRVTDEIPGLDMAPGALLIPTAWRDEGAALHAFQMNIGPAFRAAHLSDTGALAGSRLIGFRCARTVPHFTMSRAHAGLILSPPNPDVDYWALIYAEIMRDVAPGDREPPFGLGMHFAFILPSGRLLIMELWRTWRDQHAFATAKFTPALERAFAKRPTSAELPSYRAEVLGAASDLSIQYHIQAAAA